MADSFDQFDDLSWEEIDNLFPSKQGLTRIKHKDEVDIDTGEKTEKYRITRPEGYRKRKPVTARQMCNKVDAALSRGDYMTTDSFRQVRQTSRQGRERGLKASLEASIRWRSFD